MAKQYIRGSNYQPSMMLSVPWLMALTIYTLKWPKTLYVIPAVVFVILALTYLVRISTEIAVDVVKRDE